MNKRAIAAIIGVITLGALLVGLWVVPLSGPGPGTNDSTPPGNANLRAPLATNNHTVSNANAMGRPQGGSAGTSAPANDYPLLTPDQPLIRAVNGYTVTLYPEYANANRVVLRYVVQGAYGDLPRMEVFRPRLSTDQGRVLSWSSAASYAAWRLTMSPTESTLVFDAPQDADKLPSVLRLHLVMNVIGGSSTRSITGPFTFDFALPVDTVRRVAELNQTATTSSGDTIILEQVVVTRHDMRLTWRFDKADASLRTPAAGVYWDPYYVCCFFKSGEVRFMDTPGRLYTQPAGGDLIADTSVFEEQGEWVISAWYYSTWTGNRYDPPIPGPVFRFTMPPPVTTP